MKEEDINRAVKLWAEGNGYTYKGVLKNGDVVVPTMYDKKLEVDALLEKWNNNKIERIWIESKCNDGFMELLSGFVKVIFAVYYGGGKGYLACSKDDVKVLLEHKDFLKYLSEGLEVNLMSVDENLNIEEIRIR
jgi:hypothetical protein